MHLLEFKILCSEQIEHVSFSLNIYILELLNNNNSDVRIRLILVLMSWDMNVLKTSEKSTFPLEHYPDLKHIFKELYMNITIFYQQVFITINNNNFYSIKLFLN